MSSCKNYHKLYRRLQRSLERGEITSEQFQIEKLKIKDNIIHTCDYCGREYSGRKRKRCEECIPKVEPKPKVIKPKVEKPRGTWERKKEYIFKCNTCNKEFIGKSHHAKYCSSECKSNYKPYTHTCKNCGVEFKSKSIEQLYCSIECVGKHHRKHESTCLKCGKEYVHNKRHSGKFCSRDCYHKYMGFTECSDIKSYISDVSSIKRAIKAGVKYEHIDIVDLYVEHEGKCGICGDSIKLSYKHPHPLSFTIDHITPISKGGSHTRDNIRPAHLSCNIKHYNEYQKHSS